MPRRNAWDLIALSDLLAPGTSVATHAELVAAGLSLATVCRRVSPHGVWQRILPGVVLGHRGIPTRHERNLAAVKYAGEGAILTGIAALVEYGVASATRSLGVRAHVLIPHACHRTAHGFALVTRTRYLPEAILRRGVPCAPVARAVVDACRQLEKLDDVRELVAEVVQTRRCTITELRDAVLAAARQRTALTREVLREMDAGVRSAAEAKLRVAFLRRGVPEALWNADLLTRSGELVATPDALWESVLAVLEIDSMAWHLSPEAYKRTQRRQARLARHNVPVLPSSPADALADPGRTCAEVMDFLAQQVGRALPDLVVRPRAAAA